MLLISTMGWIAIGVVVLILAAFIIELSFSSAISADVSSIPSLP